MVDYSVDKDKMIDVLRSFPSMIEQASSFGDEVTFPKDFIENIVITGMGGSGYNGDLLKAYLGDTPLQIHVIKDYVLPKFVQRKSLVFAVSYSGNTEETISAYRSALRRGCKVISMSSGGKLEELAKMNNTQHVKIPKGIQPRLSTPYQFTALLNVLSYSGMIDDQEGIIKKCHTQLKAIAQKVEENSKELASKVKGKVPIIYTSNRLFALSEKWKTDINENAKTHAFYNVFPEFNHNELCSHENMDIQTHVIILSDKDDPEKIKDRIKSFKKVAAGYKVPITEIGLAGDNFLTRLFLGVWSGLFFAYYLALEYGRDPTPVNIIEKFKKSLA